MPASRLGSLFFAITGDSVSLNAEVDNTERRTKSAAGRISKDFDRIGRSMVDLGKKLTTFVTLPLVGLGTVAVKNAADLEKQRIALETMLGSAAQAQDLLRQIEDFSAGTPFQLPGLIEGSKRLLAFGIDVEAVLQTMTNLGNAAQGNQQTLDRLVDAFGKLRARGRASMEELNRFTEAGVPIVQALADGYGITTGELLKLVETGRVGFEEVNAALTALTTGTGQFAGLIEKQSQSLSGLISTLRDNIGLLLKDLGEAFVDDLKDLARWLTENVQRFRDLSEDTRRFIGIVLALTAAIGPLLVVLGTLSKLAAKNPYVVLGAAIAIIVTGIVTWRKVAHDMTEEQKLLRAAIDDTTGSLEDNSLATLENRLEAQRNLIALKEERIEKLRAKVADNELERQRIESLGGVRGSAAALSALNGVIEDQVNKIREQEDAISLLRRTMHETELQVLSLRDAQQDLGEEDNRTESQKLAAAVQRDLVKAFAEIEEKAAVYGASFDAVGEKTKAVRAAIDTLIESGLGFTATSPAVEDLIELLEELDQTSEEVIDNSVKRMRRRTSIVHQLNEAERKDLEETNELHRRIANNILSGFQNFFSSLGQISSASSEARQQDIQEEYERRRAAIEASISDEEERAAAIDALEEDLAKKQRQIERQEAENQKSFAAFNIVLQTAQAIMNMWATAPFPANLVMAALAGATGAAQLVAVAKTPLPSLDTGGLTRKDAIVQIHKDEIVTPLEEIGPLVRRAMGADDDRAMVEQPLVLQVDGTPIYRGLLKATRRGIALVDSKGVVS